MREKGFIFNSQVPEQYKTKQLGEGSCGICYLTNDNQVYKEFFSTALDLYDQIKLLSSFSSEYIAFPKSLIYRDSESQTNFLGYLMNYFEGNSFSDTSDKINILTFIRHLIKLEEEIKYISSEGITFFDLSQSNIIYSEQSGIRLIDTDLYEVGLYRDKSRNLEENMIEICNTIIVFLFHNNYIVFQDERLESLFLRCGYNGQIKPSEFLIEFVDYVNKQKNTDVKTLRQLRNKGFKYFY